MGEARRGNLWVRTKNKQEGHPLLSHGVQGLETVARVQDNLKGSVGCALWILEKKG